MHFSRLGIEKKTLFRYPQFCTYQNLPVFLIHAYFFLTTKWADWVGSTRSGSWSPHQGAGSSPGMGKDVVAEMPQVSSVGSALPLRRNDAPSIPMELMLGYCNQSQMPGLFLPLKKLQISVSFCMFLLSCVLFVSRIPKKFDKKPNDPINRSSSIGGFRNFILHSSSQDWVIRSDHHKKGLGSTRV